MTTGPKKLAARYVDGEMTDVERAGFEARLAQEPDLKTKVAELESLRGWFRGGRDEPLVPASPGFRSSVLAAARRLPTRDELLAQESAIERDTDLVDWSRRISLAAALIFGVMALCRTEKGAYAKDTVLLRVPVFGVLFKKVALSRFARTFSTLVKSGVPILGAMEIVSDTAGNKVISGIVDRARDSVRNGDSLSDPFLESSVFPPMVVKMMAIGERSGALDALLEKIAEFYDQQVEAEVKGLTSMIEPIMIAVMGVIVGGIVLAVFLPIFKLQEKLSGG